MLRTFPNTMTLFAGRSLRLASCCWCLLLAAGCGTTAIEGAAEDDYEHQHGHEIPGHRPADFSQLLPAIRARHDQLSGTVIPLNEANQNLAAELGDLLAWLPELAAESDLPEESWSKLVSQSRELLPRFTLWRRTFTVNTSTAATAPPTYPQAEIQALLSTLMEIDRDGSWLNSIYRPMVITDETSPVEATEIP
ncbi:MAG: hypothetical protein SFX18_05725 [Pirellulales bacterium]|nr:hypothetical protein [Pirellulales bacterium]